MKNPDGQILPLLLQYRFTPYPISLVSSTVVKKPSSFPIRPLRFHMPIRPLFFPSSAHLRPPRLMIHIQSSVPAISQQAARRAHFSRTLESGYQVNNGSLGP